MHLFLTFTAALGNSSKLYCARLHENWRRLGIIQVNLAYALALHKRSFVQINSYFYGDANQLRKSSIPLRD